MAFFSTIHQHYLVKIDGDSGENITDKENIVKTDEVMYEMVNNSVISSSISEETDMVNIEPPEQAVVSDMHRPEVTFETLEEEIFRIVWYISEQYGIWFHIK